MGIDAAAVHSDLLAALVVHADPKRAAGGQRYLKSDREFIGVTVPQLRKAVGATLKAHRVTERSDVLAVAAECWDGPYFESRHGAVEILVARVSVLGVADLDALGDMIRDAETWALVDPLATNVVGSIVSRSPAAAAEVLDSWAVDPESFWLRRGAMLALLKDLRAGAGDWERFTRYADEMMSDREFFIRKAIGWVLRDTSRKRPDMVWDWSIERVDQMSGVTRREAFRHLGGVPARAGAERG